jgi:hypothetical protein
MTHRSSKNYRDQTVCIRAAALPESLRPPARDSALSRTELAADRNVRAPPTASGIPTQRQRAGAMNDHPPETGRLYVV